MQWVFFVLTMLLVINSPETVFLNYPMIALSVLSIASNAYFSKNLRPFIFLFATACVVGTIFEFFGLKNGFFGSYFYITNGPVIFGVPIQVSLFWGNYYYLAHLLANRIAKKYLIFTDVLIMVGIDLFLDPVLVKLGAWKWVNGGPYFGVPLENFIGWFVVSLVISIIVRKFLKTKIYDKNNFGLMVLIATFIYLVLNFPS